MSMVYYVDSRISTLRETLTNKPEILVGESGILSNIDRGDIVAIRLHVGERGTIGEYGGQVEDKWKHSR